jgi:carnitine 3-dehydrogenase
MSEPQPIGLVGGGVIGAGWAARFLLNGHDVAIFDPDPEIARKLETVIGQARRAQEQLSPGLSPPEGRLTIAASVAEAVAGAGFVQESLPEREDLKQRVLAEIDRATRPEVIIASSTSGLLPTRLQSSMAHPERFVVGHPFNPVYLLLVKDGVATTEEIDDAIRFGAGLRWSFMGTFLIYRMAGGEAGMRHFLAQFGPALKLPWTKLEAPELTDDLIDRVSGQSDEQAAGISIRELEARRDDCLVAVLSALRGQDFGAGAVVGEHERRLQERKAAGAPGG